MTLEIRVVLPHDRPLLRAVLADPALVQAYDVYAGEEGVAHVFGTDHVPADAVHVALLDGEPVGFALALLLPADRPWAMLRGFVRPHARRRGVGRALLAHLERYLAQQTHRPDLVELACGAWEPHEPVRALIEPEGFTHAHTYWLMERPHAPLEAAAWPAGVTVRTLAEGAPIADWNEAFNRAFADHYRFVPSTVADCERLVRDGLTAPDAVLIAYDGERVVGFVRTGCHATRGEIETVGVVPEWRGRGLGRALLHWGVAWLQARTADPVTLMVEGENENALRLYRDTGFAVTRTRGLWLRPWSRA
jgi:mycothiol synthase